MRFYYTVFKKLDTHFYLDNFYAAVVSHFILKNTGMFWSDYSTG